MNPSPAAIADAHRRTTVPFARRARAVARRAAGTACALIALAPLTLAAIGLGPVSQQSALGQPFRVVVPVLLAEGENVPSECFKITPARSDADGIPQLLFGRIGVERTPSGTQVVVSNARPVSDPVVRLTIQAGCETSIRREYTLLMDPPVIQLPVVAAEAPARDEAAGPPARPAPRAAARGKGGGARGARASGGDTAAEARKPASPRSRASAKTVPRRQPAAPSARPRLTVSSAPPVGGAGARTPTDAEAEKEQQERARSIEAETAALRERIVVLTAMVERMQAEVRAQEMAQRAAEEAAKAPPPPPPPEPAWWEANEALLAAIVGLPLVIALLLLWRRRRAATTDVPWRATRPPAARAPLPPAPGLRNAPAGLANPAGATAPTPMPTPTEAKVGKAAADRNAASVLAVSELSQVTEEARVYVALGRHDRAIEVLTEHVRQTPRSMPAAWLMLLDLCHAHGRREEFRRLAEEFHLHFNVQTPSWEGFAPGEPDNGGLELYPQVARQITELWRKPECHAYLERLLCDNREGRRNGFPLAAYADILLLLQILDASAVVDIDSDLVQDGKLDLDLAPGAADTAPPPAPAPAKADARRPRKPMPPDPVVAARPVQQPIRFEFDADAATRDPPKKPRA